MCGSLDVSAFEDGRRGVELRDPKTKNVTEVEAEANVAPTW
ncbi:MAG: hypothetical protein U0263_11165 [Polyangiaceae bacterium]